MTLREVWDAQAEEWTRFARNPAADRANFLFNIPRFLELLPPPGRATLDLGCGEGRVGVELQRRGHRVVGVDSSPRMVASAAEVIPAEVADAIALPFESGAFDLVAAFMSLQDMDDMAAAFREAARVLERGGRFCFAVVHPINSAGEFEERGDDPPFKIEGLYLRERRFERLVDRDGYRVLLAAIHHPLEAYSRALEDAGFLLEALRDPVAVPEWPRWRRVPLFLHVRAVKP